MSSLAEGSTEQLDPRAAQTVTGGRLASLFRLPRAGGFPLVWSGHSVTMLGNELSRVAVPTLAILALGARPFEVGLLAAAGWVAWPVLALVAGVWIDRWSRVRTMHGANVVRSLVFGAVVVLALMGHLSLGLLITAALVVGAAAVFFELASTAYVAEAVPPAEIPIANSRLEASRSTAQLAGPGLGGTLIAALGPAPVIALDAIGLAVAALLLRRVRPTYRQPRPGRRDFRRDLAEGLDTLRRDPVLLRITFTVAISNLGLMAAHTVLLLHLYRALSLDPATVGLILAFPGIGALIGVAMANRLTVRVGVGWALIAATVLESGLLLGVALAPRSLAVPLVALALGSSAFWGVIWNIIAVSVRQVALPAELQARVASIRGTIGYSVIPAGSIAGGLMAELLLPHVGVGAFAATIAGGSVVGVLSAAPLLARRVAPLRSWRFGESWPYEQSPAGDR